MIAKLGQPIKAEEEKAILQCGYFSIMNERAPINQDPDNCFNEASAYLLYLEQLYSQIPNELQFQNIKDEIESPHKERITELWNKLVTHQSNLELTIAALKAKWKNPPKNISQESARHMVEEFKMSIPEDFKAGLQAIISIPEKAEPPATTKWREKVTEAVRHNIKIVQANYSSPRKLLKELKEQEIKIPTAQQIARKILEKLEDTKTTEEKQEELRLWQKDEKSLRTSAFFAFKNYIMALRAYYVMLNEKSEDQSKSVLPLDHPERQRIAVRTRYLEIIDATHQALSATKAAIHELKGKRVRKTMNWVPSWAHAVSVTLETIKDVVPYSIEEEDMDIDLITLITSAAVHDLIEDTGYDTDYLIDEFLKRLMDMKDSSVAQAIKTGFPEDYRKKAARIRTSQHQQEEDYDEEEGENSEMILRLFQEKLDLIGKNRKRWIRQVIRIVSNNTKLTAREARNALTSPLVDQVEIIQLFEIDEKDIRGWNIPRSETSRKQTKTFEEFPEEWDEGKLTKFLIRLNSITESEKVRQIALLIKLEDRSDNISTIQGMKPEKRISTLRSTVTRLLAWCMLDHNQNQTSLFNAISSLIDITLNEYKKLQSETPEKMEKIDEICINQLEEWQRKVIRLEVPEKIKEVFKNFQRQKAA